MHDPSGPTSPASSPQAREPASVSVPPIPAPSGGTRTWTSPGVPLRRRVLTGAGVTLAAAVFFFLALWQGASMLVSTIIGVVFIGGFIGYLRVVAPTPFTLTLDSSGMSRAERGRETVQIPWSSVAKVKEERFKSDKTISLTVYKRVGERGLYRAFVVYRDDIGDFDGLLTELRAGTPADRPWIVETVHE
jgi:hypothetical protein